MSFSVGIIGLPNVGKSTLFKALTKKSVDIADYPFTTIHPNVGVVAVPDKRLEKIAEIIKPEKITPTVIEFIDIAGLVKDSHKGEGLGNQFLAQIRNCDALVEIVKAFENRKGDFSANIIDPEKDIEVVRIELLMKDLENLESLLSKTEKEAKTKEKKVLKKIEFFKKVKTAVAQGKLISEIDLTKEEKLEIKEYQFLTAKPIIYILNVDEKKLCNTDFYNPAMTNLSLNLKLEEEICQLSEKEVKELEIESQLDQLVLACYNILNLITFFTITGGKETKAWTIQKGVKCPEAGGRIHSDFEEKFIRAEVINWQKLVETGNWRNARELGWLKTVGREYEVQDGDVIEFK